MFDPTNSEMNPSNSIIGGSGLQFGIRLDNGSLAKLDDSGRNFVIPLKQGETFFFWLVIKSLNYKVALDIAVNKKSAPGRYIIERGQKADIDAQLGGGKLFITRVENAVPLVQAYNSVGIRGEYGTISLNCLFCKEEPISEYVTRQPDGRRSPFGYDETERSSVRPGAKGPTRSRSNSAPVVGASNLKSEVETSDVDCEIDMELPQIQTPFGFVLVDPDEAPSFMAMLPGVALPAPTQQVIVR